MAEKASKGGAVGMHEACRAGDLSRVQQIIEKGGNPRKCDKLSRAPLHLACWAGQLEVVRFLCGDEVGVDPNQPAQDNFTPLHFCAQGGHVDCCRLLLERGANVDAAVLPADLEIVTDLP